MQGSETGRPADTQADTQADTSGLVFEDWTCDRYQTYDAGNAHPYSGACPIRSKITGVVCGDRVEDVEETIMKIIRYLDKLVDKLA